MRKNVELSIEPKFKTNNEKGDNNKKLPQQNLIKRMPKIIILKD